MFIYRILILFSLLYSYLLKAAPEEDFNSAAARRCLRNFHQKKLSVEAKIDLINKYRNIASEYYKGQFTIKIDTDSYSVDKRLHQTNYCWKVLKTCPNRKNKVLAHFSFNCPDDKVSSRTGSSDSGYFRIDRKGRVHRFRTFEIDIFKPAYTKKNIGIYESLSIISGNRENNEERFHLEPFSIGDFELNKIYELKLENHCSNCLVSFSEKGERLELYDLKNVEAVKVDALDSPKTSHCGLILTRSKVPCEMADLSTQGEDFMNPQSIFLVQGSKWKELEIGDNLTLENLDCIGDHDEIDLVECHSRVNLLLSDLDRKFVEDTDIFLEWFLQHKAISVVMFDNSSRNKNFIIDECFSPAWEQIDEIIIDYDKNPMAIIATLNELAGGLIFESVKKVQIPDITFDGDGYHLKVLERIRKKYSVDFKSLK